MQSAVISVVDASQVFEVRRAGLKLAQSLGWDETSTGELSLVLTEMGTNLAKHAKEGQIHIRDFERNGAVGIEALSIDRGPGVRHIEECLTDGYSTAGTAGTGLGAIRRLASEFDIYSQENRGTTVVARLFPGTTRVTALGAEDMLLVGSTQVAVHGETECGDSWGLRSDNGNTIILMADGLGHGPGAAAASREAVAALQRAKEFAPTAILEDVHHALRPTRGAAVAIAYVDSKNEQVRFAGVGNISAVLVHPTQIQHMISHNGTAGHNVRRFQEFVYPWKEKTLLVMHSDGIATNWRLDSYPGLNSHDPSLLAAVLLRDSSRTRDDACVVVAR